VHNDISPLLRYFLFSRGLYKQQNISILKHAYNTYLYLKSAA